MSARRKRSKTIARRERKKSRKAGQAAGSFQHIPPFGQVPLIHRTITDPDGVKHEILD